LRQAILIKHRDDEPKITPRACVEDVLACADPLDNPARLSKSQNHGALPVPLVARQPGEVLRVSLSIHDVIRPLQQHGSPQGASNRRPAPGPAASKIHRRAASDFTAA